MRRRRKCIVSGILKHTILIIMAFMVLFPITWIVLQSFKSYFDTIAVPPKILFSPVWRNYIDVLGRVRFFSSFRDSLVIALGSVGLTLLIGTPFSYALTRFNFKGRDNIAFFVLSTRMMPPIVVIVPFIRIFHMLNIADTHLGLILAHVLVNLALVIWMMRGFFSSIPREIEEAAIVDGCSQMGAFWWVTLPLSAPGLVATAILAFLFSWNELLFALTLTSLKVKTLPVYMATEFVGYLAVQWGPLSASGVLAILPPLFFIIFIQKHLVRGLTFGALK